MKCVLAAAGLKRARCTETAAPAPVHSLRVNDEPMLSHHGNIDTRVGDKEIQPRSEPVPVFHMLCHSPQQHALVPQLPKLKRSEVITSLQQIKNPRFVSTRDGPMARVHDHYDDRQRSATPQHEDAEPNRPRVPLLRPRPAPAEESLKRF